MKQIWNIVANTSLSTLGNGLVAASGGVVTLCAVGLVGLYLTKYVDHNTPEMVALQCAVGISRVDCPDVDAERKIDDLERQIADAEAKLKALKMLEDQSDSMTVFRTVKIPDTTFSVTIGTQFRDLVKESTDQDVPYFCYISLGKGALNEERNLHIRQPFGDPPINVFKLRDAGVSQKALDFAFGECKPVTAGGA